MQFQIIDIPIADLQRNTGQIPGVHKNPRIIKDNNFKKLQNSIEEDPDMLQLREILVYQYEGKNYIIGGNMRFEALKALKYETVTVKLITDELNEATAAKLNRIILKDNSAYGEWDFDELANEWNEALIRACAIEIPTMDEAKMEEEAEEDNFNPDDIEQEPTVKRGDIWQLGDHRLLCGDCTKAEDVARLMNGEQADLWLTDPPYNVDYNQKYNDMLDAGVGSPNSIRHEDISNDKMSDADFDNFLLNAFSAANNVMKAGCSFYVWTAQGHILTQFASALDKVGLEFRQQIIWCKNTFVPGRSDYQWIHEPCFYGWKAGAAHYFTKHRDRSTVYSDGEEIDIDKLKKDEMNKLLHDILDSKIPESVIRCPKPQRSGEHPTMKPVRLFGYLMRNSSRQHDIILDTFGGSGTTIVAAEQLNRRARLMEIDPHYCDVIIARWEKLTGNQAVKLKNLLTTE